MIFPKANGEYQVRINLSSLAQSVLEADAINFGLKRNALLNKIIRNFYEEADASIPLAIQRERTRLNRLFETLRSEQKKQMINILLNDYKNKLQQKVREYKTGDVRNYPTLRLNDDNAELLFFGAMSSEDESTARKNAENFYQNRVSKYLKALFEEYAQKTYLEREAIILAEEIKVIEDAMQEGKQLRVKTVEGETVYIKPYQVTPDSMANYYYLVGCRVITQENETVLQNTSYRIARLREIKRTSASGFLKNERKKELEQELQIKDAQFMSGNLNEIKVYLTDDGIKKYNRILHLRPHYTRKESEHIYVFNTTPEQIEFYFFKFGADAILLPMGDEVSTALRENFYQMYKDAVSAYEKPLDAITE